MLLEAEEFREYGGASYDYGFEDAGLESTQASLVYQTIDAQIT